MLVLVENTKRCTKCGETKPATAEYFYRDKRQPDGLKLQCKSCHREYYAIRREEHGRKRREHYVARHGEHPAKVLAKQGLKKCSKCKQIFAATVEHFRPHTLGREGLHPWCRACDLAYSRMLDHANRPRISAKRKALRRKNAAAVRERDKYYRTKNPRRISEARLRHFYGLSVEDVEWMKQQQNSLCAICGNPPHGRGGYSVLCVDHDHETNRVRELLCGACNSGLGQFRDSVEILERALAYLKKHKSASGVLQCAS